MRLAEFGTVYRYEQSGELHGLTRVRGSRRTTPTLFVRPDQLLEEFERVIDIVLYIFKTLKFDSYTAQISLRDPNNKEKYIGSDENWEKAESAIMQAAKEKASIRWSNTARPPSTARTRLHGQGRHRPQVATRNDPGRLQPPGAL